MSSSVGGGDVRRQSASATASSSSSEVDSTSLSTREGFIRAAGGGAGGGGVVAGGSFVLHPIPPASVPLPPLTAATAQGLTVTSNNAMPSMSYSLSTTTTTMDGSSSGSSIGGARRHHGHRNVPPIPPGGAIHQQSALLSTFSSDEDGGGVGGSVAASSTASQATNNSSLVDQAAKSSSSGVDEGERLVNFSRVLLPKPLFFGRELPRDRIQEDLTQMYIDIEESLVPPSSSSSVAGLRSIHSFDRHRDGKENEDGAMRPNSSLPMPSMGVRSTSISSATKAAVNASLSWEEPPSLAMSLSRESSSSVSAVSERSVMDGGATSAGAATESDKDNAVLRNLEHCMRVFGNGRGGYVESFQPKWDCGIVGGRGVRSLGSLSGLDGDGGGADGEGSGAASSEMPEIMPSVGMRSASEGMVPSPGEPPQGRAVSEPTGSACASGGNGGSSGAGNIDVSKHTPLYGCDDTSLPTETDLGQFQTREEQLTYQAERDVQRCIQDEIVPNVFNGQIVKCPSPATDVDDGTSWNSRSAGVVSVGGKIGGGGGTAGVVGMSAGAPGGGSGATSTVNTTGSGGPNSASCTPNGSPSRGVGGGAPPPPPPPPPAAPGSVTTAGSGQPGTARNAGSIIGPANTTTSGGVSGPSPQQPPKGAPTKNAGIGVVGSGGSIGGLDANTSPSSNASVRSDRSNRSNRSNATGLSSAGRHQAPPTPVPTPTPTPPATPPLPSSRGGGMTANVAPLGRPGPRVGWWTTRYPLLPDPTCGNVGVAGPGVGATGGGSSPDNRQQQAYMYVQHDVETGLQPRPHDLRKKNLPLSMLHPATTTARLLPHLSDRPPSFRYLQIDTQVLGFPPLGGELEPLYCTMCIYHVESVVTSKMSLDGESVHRQDSGGTTGSGTESRGRIVWNKCGRVTESLKFDMVTEDAVEDGCAAGLWPYNLDVVGGGEGKKKEKGGRSADGGGSGPKRSNWMQGTRCGVFPLPSNLDMSNLYAVLIVHKVLSDELDLEPYLKPPKNGHPNLPASSSKQKLRGDASLSSAASSKQKSRDVSMTSSSSASSGAATTTTPSSSDINKLRSRAAKCSDRLGMFLTPFAFGVAPLLQAIGDDVPLVPTSRAVQIPLFKLQSGMGERPILDHIMVMRHPRSDSYASSGGTAAELTKGGKAMLVMRNFGYLGLHCVIDRKSSLARDRLVDFTGEQQIRRRRRDEDERNHPQELAAEGWNTRRVPPWNPQFTSERTVHGGRNCSLEEYVDERPPDASAGVVGGGTSLSSSGASPKVAAKAGAGAGAPSAGAASACKLSGRQSHLFANELAPIPLSVTYPHGGMMSVPASMHHANAAASSVGVSGPGNLTLTTTGVAGGSVGGPGGGNKGGLPRPSYNITQSPVGPKAGHSRSGSAGSIASIVPPSNPGVVTTSNNSADVEPTVHNSLVHELILHPRWIHNCPKRNVVLKVEMCKLTWLTTADNSRRHLIALPFDKPRVHNPRRGPWLVHSAFGSCAYHMIDPHFLDEFKLKLPLVMQKNHVVVLTVYNVSVRGKRSSRLLPFGGGGERHHGQDRDHHHGIGSGGFEKAGKMMMGGGRRRSAMEKKAGNLFLRTGLSASPDKKSPLSRLISLSGSSDSGTSDVAADQTKPTAAAVTATMTSTGAELGMSQRSHQSCMAKWCSNLEVLGCGVLPLCYSADRQHQQQQQQQQPGKSTEERGDRGATSLVPNELHDVSLNYLPKAIDLDSDGRIVCNLEALAVAANHAHAAAGAAVAGGQHTSLSSSNHGHHRAKMLFKKSSSGHGGIGVKHHSFGDSPSHNEMAPGRAFAASEGFVGTEVLPPTVQAEDVPTLSVKDAIVPRGTILLQSMRHAAGDLGERNTVSPGGGEKIASDSPVGWHHSPPPLEGESIGVEGTPVMAKKKGTSKFHHLHHHEQTVGGGSPSRQRSPLNTSTISSGSARDFPPPPPLAAPQPRFDALMSLSQSYSLSSSSNSSAQSSGRRLTTSTFSQNSSRGVVGGGGSAVSPQPLPLPLPLVGSTGAGGDASQLTPSYSQHQQNQHQHQHHLQQQQQQQKQWTLFGLGAGAMVDGHGPGIDVEDGMVLQIRTIAISSVSCQNASLARFFHEKVLCPRLLTEDEMTGSAGKDENDHEEDDSVTSTLGVPWKAWKSRDDLITYLRHGESSTTGMQSIESGETLDNEERLRREEERRLAMNRVFSVKNGFPALLDNVKDICKHTPPSELVSHLHRLTGTLFTLLVSGNTGQPSLQYANPCQIAPLRIHAFSTLLHVLQSVVVFQNRHGVRQLDGRGRWNVTSMGKLVAVLLDESHVMGDDGSSLLMEDGAYDLLEEDYASTDEDEVDAAALPESKNHDNEVLLLQATREGVESAANARVRGATVAASSATGSLVDGSIVRSEFVRQPTPFPLQTSSKGQADKQENSGIATMGTDKDTDKPKENDKAPVSAFAPATASTFTSSPNQVIGDSDFLKLLQPGGAETVDDIFKEPKPRRRKEKEDEGILNGSFPTGASASPAVTSDNQVIGDSDFLKLLQPGGAGAENSDEVFTKPAAKRKGGRHKRHQSASLEDIFGAGSGSISEQSNSNDDKSTVTKERNDDSSGNRSTFAPGEVLPKVSMLENQSVTPPPSKASPESVASSSTNSTASSTASANSGSVDGSVGSSNSAFSFDISSSSSGSISSSSAAADDCSSSASSSPPSASSPPQKPHLHVDSKFDFQSALRQSAMGDSSDSWRDDIETSVGGDKAASDDLLTLPNHKRGSSPRNLTGSGTTLGFGSSTSDSMMNLGGDGGGVGVNRSAVVGSLGSSRRKWKTLPSASMLSTTMLATIVEGDSEFGSGEIKSGYEDALTNSPQRTATMTRISNSVMNGASTIAAESTSRPLSRGSPLPGISEERLASAGQVPGGGALAAENSGQKEAQLDTEMHAAPRKAPKQFRIPKKSSVRENVPSEIGDGSGGENGNSDSSISSIPNSSISSIPTSSISSLPTSSISSIPTSSISSIPTSSISSLASGDKGVGLDSKPSRPAGGANKRRGRSNKTKSQEKARRHATDEEIESAGTAFLDVIGKNLGLGVSAKDMGGEERRVGEAHHRKTQSRCSIDWTLPPPDLILENQQRIEQLALGQGFGFESSTLDGAGGLRITGSDCTSGDDDADENDDVDEEESCSDESDVVAGKKILHGMDEFGEKDVGDAGDLASWHPLLDGAHTDKKLKESKDSGTGVDKVHPLLYSSKSDHPLLDGIGASMSSSSSATVPAVALGSFDRGSEFVASSVSSQQLIEKGATSLSSGITFSAAKKVKCIKLRGFIDRIVAMSSNGHHGRWWPYVYEVIIYQWVIILMQQTKSGGDSHSVTSGAYVSGGGRRLSRLSEGSHNILSCKTIVLGDLEKSQQAELASIMLAAASASPEIHSCLSEAASRAKGITISCAPILFEIIKKSLGYRIQLLLRHLERKKQQKKEKRPADSSSVEQITKDSNGRLEAHTTSSTSEKFKARSTLVSLDHSLLQTLENLIVMVTDACIDSRNFDSFAFRQTSIDVNDSIVRFLRDLFAYLEEQSVHRLILIYFSRYIVKEGKHWSNRDSKIGLICSWETCKLRLNAITLLIRLPDFVKVNVPLIENLDARQLSHHSSGSSARWFFSAMLEQLESLGMASFAASEGLSRRASVDIPSLKPHWLAELVTDVCLAAAGHAEQSIQHRASSLLYELFWAHNQEGKARGTLSVIGSMYITFINKVLEHLGHLACLPPKSQLRKDILPCVIFVLQSAPPGLLRALWRKLCQRAVGKSRAETFGGVAGFANDDVLEEETCDDSVRDNASGIGNASTTDRTEVTISDELSILDVFSLMNLAIKTFEYEGSESNVEEGDEHNDQIVSWQREYLQSEEHQRPSDAKRGMASSRFPLGAEQDGVNGSKGSTTAPRYTTAGSRKWHAHDGAIVIINTSRSIVKETLWMLRPSGTNEEGQSDSLCKGGLNLSDIMPAASFSASRRSNEKPHRHKRGLRHQRTDHEKPLNFSISDTVIFVRATTSLYLHILSLRQSDIVIVKSLTAAVEVLKIFGIKIFLAAVGETLQHWMRVVLIHGGARRANVRVQALEFLALMLRLTWDSYGSFFRVRVPLLAVQTEVMERIVAIATGRHYREQRQLGKPVEYLSNDAAEASLSPLWRTLDRLHHQSASQNVAFRSALVRLAEMMKKLYRAYIAAHALTIATRCRSSSSPTSGKNDVSSETVFNAERLRRITSSSAGVGRQFLGLHSTPSHREAVTHDEAVEEAFLAAAEVFPPMELPSHRVAWLRKLAEFHFSRNKFAEEASCHYRIHVTLRQAARMHDSIWNSGPFLPWATDQSDGIHFDGEGPVGGPGEYGADYDDLEGCSIDDYDPKMIDTAKSGSYIEKTDSFRRLFRRAANSVRMRTGDWETWGNKNAFYGVADAADYSSFSPWITLREIEEDMVEEAETAGDRFLKAGIVESSRSAWSLATQFYSETFNYARLAYAYRKLSRVVASQVPVVDTSSPLELSSQLGRFYRVWFHGSAPDELVGAEFVYRAAVSVKLEEFGKRISDVLKSLLPEGTAIDLVLDDGRPEETKQKRPSQRRMISRRIEPRGALGVCQIKVTPLRPLSKSEKNSRGSPEWFYNHSQAVGTAFGGGSRRFGGMPDDGSRYASNSPHHRTGKRTSSDQDSRSVQSSVASTAGFSSGRAESSVTRTLIGSWGASDDIIGVDTFTFTQPTRKDRRQGGRDWFKAPVNFAEKSLKVTKLEVEQNFPACVSRQPVKHRSVFYQSPLEAGVEAVCSWCAVLFRTAVATIGLSVIGPQTDTGIGIAAAKVVADCIHCSRVKEMGQALLNTSGYSTEGDDDEPSSMLGRQHGKLSEDEVTVYQNGLARCIVIFMELLHLLIARNRDLLLAVVNARKRGDTSVYGHKRTGTALSLFSNPPSPESAGRSNRYVKRGRDVTSVATGEGQHPGSSADETEANDASSTNNSVATAKGYERTDSAIAVQSELQRAFISLAKTLYPVVSNIIGSDTPRWLKLCSQDRYFSSGSYSQTNITMGEELFFFGGADSPEDDDGPRASHGLAPVPSVSVSSDHQIGIGPVRSFSPASGSVCSGASKKSESKRSTVMQRSPTRSATST